MADEDGALGTARVVRGEKGSHDASYRMADHGHSVDVQGVEDGDGLPRPQGGAIAEPMVAVAQAVANVVEGDDPMPSAQTLRQALLPVRDAATGSVKKEKRLAGALVENVHAAQGRLEERGLRIRRHLGG